jgi:peptidyl-prolyl cis-trans isomerase SurA
LTIPDAFYLLTIAAVTRTYTTEERYFTMKRSLILATILAIASSAVWAQAIDKPAATARLTKTASVSVSQLRKALAPFEAQAKRSLTLDERKLVLDKLVVTLLIGQAAERDKIIVSDAEVKQELANTEKQLGAAANLGRDMTEAELQQYVKTSGGSWEDYVKSVRENKLLINYTLAKRKGLIEGVKPVTDQDVQDFYDSNKGSFFADDMLSIRHLFIDTHLLTTREDRDKAAKRAQDIYRELKGGAAFGDLVMKYSEDTASKYKGGDIGMILRSNPQQKQFYGNDFFDAVFKLKKGETSGVIQSNLGYHIVQVVNKFDAKLLTLDDKVPAQNQMLVRDYIKTNLGMQRQRDAIAKALDELVVDLKKQAEIKVFDDNINW